MRLQNLLQLFCLISVIGFLAGCRNSLEPIEPTATFTPEPPTATPTPVPPTDTPTPLPPTPTPVPPPTPTPEQVNDMVFKTPEEAIYYPHVGFDL
jgi:hypothetical protein